MLKASPLTEAARNGDADIVRLLIEKGANVNKGELVRLKHKWYMLHRVKSATPVVRWYDCELLRNLNRQQGKPGQNIFRDQSFIQGGAKFM